MEPFEPPKYLASLVASINEGAKSAQLGALAFAAIGVFLLASTFAATDEDLLLNHPLTIAQLGGVSVPVAFAFGIAPALFVAVHLYTLIRYDMLRSNLQRFNADLAAMVPTAVDRDRCRQLLANVEFVNAQAMPRGSPATSWLFRPAVVGLLAVFPVVVLLLVQIGALRLQSDVVSGVHQVAVAADLALLIWYFGRPPGFWRRRLWLSLLSVPVMVADLDWLSVPSLADMGAVKSYVQSDILARDVVDFGDVPDEHTNLLQLFRAVLVQPIDLLLCPALEQGWGCRFLTVARRPIIPKVWDTKTFVELRSGNTDEKHRAAIEPASLRGRGLRFAFLEKSEFFNADLTGARLQGAVLTGAQLLGADLHSAQLQDAMLEDASLNGANLFLAKLQRVSLNGAYLRGATLTSVELQNADISNASLQGAFIGYAHLQKAHLRNAQLQGAVLIRAELQGGDLSDAQLQGADLEEADLSDITATSNTELGLSDLRHVTFNSWTDDQKQLLRVNAQAGPVLIDASQSEALVALINGRVTTDVAYYGAKLAEYLAEKVATVSPETALGIADRAIVPPFAPDEMEVFHRDLSCRLIALEQARQVSLPALILNTLKSRFTCP